MIPYKDLTKEQQGGYDLAYSRLRSGEDVTVIGGFAGVGKSTVLAALSDMLPSQTHYCCYTGRAANLLRQKMPDKTSCISTIHSLIYRSKKDDRENIIGWRKRQHLEDVDLIVIDEVSMVDDPLWKDLKSYGIPILAFGDHGQLPPVSGNSVFGTHLDYMLTHIHRQAEGNPIIALSRTIREEGVLPTINAGDDRLLQLTPEQANDAILQMYKGLPWGEIATLTYTNRTRLGLNKWLRGEFGSKEAWVGEGDIVICLRNDQDAGIFNGMRGEVTKARKFDKWHSKATIHFPADDLTLSLKLFHPQLATAKTFSKIEHIETVTGGDINGWDQVGDLFSYGWAMTVHKMQGDQVDTIVLAYEYPSLVSQEDFTRWAYTAVTRAVRRLVVVR